MDWKVVEGGHQDAPLVLVADDDESLRDCIGKVLRSAGFSVLAVEDGRAAVEGCRQAGGRVRAVVLDMVMPAMDGGAALRALRALDARLPVVVCSGLHPVEILRRTGEARPTSILRKPVAPDTLVQAVRRAIADAALGPDPTWPAVRGARPASEGRI